MFTLKLLVILAFVGPVITTIPNLTQEQCEKMANEAELTVAAEVLGGDARCVPQESTQDHQWDEKRDGKGV
jgi:hypothetical protein